MALTTFVSPVQQTITTVQHLNGVAAVYSFTAGVEYTAVTQEEEWILREVGRNYGLVFDGEGFGLSAYGVAGFGL